MSHNLKKEIIDTLIDKIYPNDLENREKNLEHLNSLTLEQLDMMLGNYYLFTVKNKTKDC